MVTNPRMIIMLSFATTKLIGEDLISELERGDVSEDDLSMVLSLVTILCGDGEVEIPILSQHLDEIHKLFSSALKTTEKMLQEAARQESAEGNLPPNPTGHEKIMQAINRVEDSQCVPYEPHDTFPQPTDSNTIAESDEAFRPMRG